MTKISGSGSASGSIRQSHGSSNKDPDPDPPQNVMDPQRFFLKVHLHHFTKIQSQKEPQNRRNQGFSYYFFLMIEGSGSVPLTKGPGSGPSRPKTIRIRIRNTVSGLT
jgi:hypothetical protein